MCVGFRAEPGLGNLWFLLRSGLRPFVAPFFLFFRTAQGDTIDASLTLVSSTATRGSYDQLTHTWTVGDLTQGAMADTLRIQVQTTAPGIVSNRARFGGLVLEVDTNSGNNTAVSNPNLTVN